MNRKGIYKITNIINGKVYVGESLNIDRRWDEHKEELNNNKHHSYKLQKEWNEYGEGKFIFEILTVLDKDIKKFSDQYILLIYEDYYIKEYNSIEKGYNVENTLYKILNGEKKVFQGKNDAYSIEIYQKQINNKKIINENGLIFNPKYYGIKELQDLVYNGRPRPKAVDKFLFGNDIICRCKDNKHKYELTEKYKECGELFLNYEPIYKIRFTEKGFEMLKELLIETK